MPDKLVTCSLKIRDVSNKNDSGRPVHTHHITKIENPDTTKVCQDVSPCFR